MSRRVVVLGCAVLAGLLAACGASSDTVDVGDVGEVVGTITQDPTEAATMPDQPPMPMPTGDPVERAAASVNAFTAEVFAQVEDGENLIVSPASIAMALTQAWAGAAGPTADEIAAVLHLPGDALAAYGALDRAVTFDGGEGGPIVATGNRLFPDDSLVLRQPYVDDVTEAFGAGVEPLALRADPSGSRDHINQYVAEQTRDRIPAALGPDFLTPDSILVLVNTLYLEANWVQPFGEGSSDIETFATIDGRTVDATFMRDGDNNGVFGVRGDGWIAAGKELAGGFETWIVLPDEGVEVANVLTLDTFDAVGFRVGREKAVVDLPRFAITSRLDLTQVLPAMGIRTAFMDGAADFSGITDRRGLFLESAVHVADIELDEDGVVAAAATAFGASVTSAGPPPPPPTLEVVADRPFGFLIRHVETGAVLFIGQVTDPSI